MAQVHTVFQRSLSFSPPLVSYSLSSCENVRGFKCVPVGQGVIICNICNLPYFKALFVCTTQRIMKSPYTRNNAFNCLFGARFSRAGFNVWSCLNRLCLNCTSLCFCSALTVVSCYSFRDEQCWHFLASSTPAQSHALSC